MKNLFALLVVLPLFASAQSGEKNFIDQNYIEVTGKSQVEVTPDKIYIRILLNEKDNKNRTPLADRERLMIAKLKELGVDINKDLLVKQMASNFKDYWLSHDEILLSKTYQLMVKDGKTAAGVFIELEKLGISSVSIEKLDNSQIEKYRREVKIEAIKAAKDKAQALATAIGQSAGRAIFVQELDQPDVRGMSNTIMVRGANSLYGSRSPEASAIPDVDFEKIILAYEILVRFELK